MQRVGSRAQVMHGNAKMTGEGLRKKDLKYNKQGKIVSKKMSKLAKKEKRLQKAGYTTKKGQFGAVRIMKGGKGSFRLIPQEYQEYFPQKYKNLYITDLSSILLTKNDDRLRYDINEINGDSDSVVYSLYTDMNLFSNGSGPGYPIRNQIEKIDKFRLNIINLVVSHKYQIENIKMYGGPGKGWIKY